MRSILDSIRPLFESPTKMSACKSHSNALKRVTVYFPTAVARNFMVEVAVMVCVALLMRFLPLNNSVLAATPEAEACARFIRTMTPTGDNLPQLLGSRPQQVRQAIEILSNTSPANSQRHIILHGPVGSGKSLVWNAIVNALTNDAHSQLITVDTRTLAMKGPITLELGKPLSPSDILDSAINTRLKEAGGRVIVHLQNADELFAAESSAGGQNKPGLLAVVRNYITDARVSFVFETQNATKLKADELIANHSHPIKIAELSADDKRRAVRLALKEVVKKYPSVSIPTDDASIDRIIKIGRDFSANDFVVGAKDLVEYALREATTANELGPASLQLLSQDIQNLSLDEELTDDQTEKLRIKAQKEEKERELTELENRFVAAKTAATKIITLQAKLKKLQSNKVAAHRAANALHIEEDLKNIDTELRTELAAFHESGASAMIKLELTISDLQLASQGYSGSQARTDEITTRRLFEAGAMVKQRILGASQAEAIDETMRMTRLHWLGGKPNPVVVAFHGPTGTGKTSTAIEIAAAVFPGEEDAIEIIPLSEYSEAHLGTRLTGGSATYIGYDDEPLLPMVIRRRGGKEFVLVLDEIEKAHRDVLRKVMQFIDTGRIQDQKSQIHIAEKMLVVMTSNLADKTIAGFLHHNQQLARDLESVLGRPPTAAEKAAVNSLDYVQRAAVVEEVRRHFEEAVFARIQANFILQPVDDIKKLMQQKFSAALKDFPRLREHGISELVLDESMEKLLEKRAYSAFLGVRGTNSYMARYLLAEATELLDPRGGFRYAPGDKLSYRVQKIGDIESGDDQVVFEIVSATQEIKFSKVLFSVADMPYVDDRLNPRLIKARETMASMAAATSAQQPRAEGQAPGPDAPTNPNTRNDPETFTP